MKKLCTMIMIAFTLKATAQIKQPKDRLHFFTQLNQQQNKQHKKVRALEQRLIADSTFVFDNTSQSFLINSHAAYNYDTMRGSTQSQSDLMEYNNLNNVNDFYHHTILSDQQLIQTYSSGVLDQSYKVIASYTTNHLLSEEFLLIHNGITWDSVNKFNYNYNGSLLATTTGSSYDNVLQQWNEIFKDEAIYNNNDQIIELILWNMNGTTWKKIYRDTMMYAGNNLVQRKHDNWITFSQTWKLQSTTLIDYTSFNKPTWQLTLKPNNLSSLLDTQWRYNYSYDVNNLIDSFQSYEYSYDTLGVHIYPRDGYRYFHTASNPLFDSVLYYENGSIFYKFIHQFNNHQHITNTHVLHWSNAINGWEEYADKNYYYEDYLVATKLNDYSNIRSLNLFPNPSSQYTWLTYFDETNKPAIVQINDFSGRLITSQIEPGRIGDHLIQFNTSTLKPGIYLVSIQSEKAKAIQLKLCVNR